jgi:hypothetical protein
VISISSTSIEQLDGKAFELSVASELLLRGFNCSMPVVDAGIDILAWRKNAKALKVQVKGRNFSGHGTTVEGYRFRKSSYEDPSTKPDFIVMILRYTRGTHSAPFYGSMSRLIIPVDKFDELVKKDLVVERGDYLVANVYATFENGVATKVVFQKGYGTPRPGKDMTKFLNAWKLLHSF